MASLIEWALKWKIPPEALRELCESAQYIAPADDNDLEARVQSEVRLAAAKSGRYLFRNNRGAGKMASGTFVRYGLANDSKQLGDEFKSGDLIGWQPLVIRPEMVGRVVAQFLSVECKRRNWKPSNSLEDMAQNKWAALVNAQGGRAIITNTADTL